MTNINVIRTAGDIESESDWYGKKNEWGLNVTTAYEYKNILVEAYFYKGLDTSHTRCGKIMNPGTAFGIKLGYLFHLFDKINLSSSRKEACPTF